MAAKRYRAGGISSALGILLMFGLRMQHGHEARLPGVPEQYGLLTKCTVDEGELVADDEGIPFCQICGTQYPDLKKN